MHPKPNKVAKLSHSSQIKPVGSSPAPDQVQEKKEEEVGKASSLPVRGAGCGAGGRGRGRGKQLRSCEVRTVWLVTWKFKWVFKSVCRFAKCNIPVPLFPHD
jgi:hypothetical protein